MQRYTISLDDDLAAKFDQWTQERGYQNRSEAIRDLLHERLGSESLEQDPGGHCVAAVSYVYDHHERELGRRLIELQHRHHGLTVSTLHVHLDTDRCLEVAILRGHTDEVRTEAGAMIAERGVRHGRIQLIPEQPAALHGGHSHGHSQPQSDANVRLPRIARRKSGQ